MLSMTTRYALRALLYLARQAGEGPVLGREIAARVHIPANYLSKILWTLRNAGLLETTRGQGGGYRLSRPAEDIRLIEIVRLFEGPRPGSGCLLGGDHECSDRDPCSAHAVWKKAKDAFTEFLNSTSIAEIGVPDRLLLDRFDKIGRPRKRQAASRR